MYVNDIPINCNVDTTEINDLLVHNYICSYVYVRTYLKVLAVLSVTFEFCGNSYSNVDCNNNL